MECHKHGRVYSLDLAKGRVYRNPKGDPVRMMGTVLDVTEQKRAQESLQESEREFRQLAEAMPQIVWATTADGLNIYFNGSGWTTPASPWKRATAKAGSPFPPGRPAARGMPGSVRRNTVTAIRLNAVCGAPMASTSGG